MSTREEVINRFQTLSSDEAELVSNEGSTRKWIEGGGQTVSWADSTAQLVKKEDGIWVAVKVLDRSMTGLLPRNWALEFSGGKVKEG